MNSQITILGPPGTGKTSALIHLYRYLTGDTSPDVENFVQQYGFDRVITRTDYTSDEVLFLTFTTSAVRVLKERGIYNAHTLHSYITKVLMRNKLLTPARFMRDPFIAAMMEMNYGYDFRDRFSSHPSNVAEIRYNYYFNVYYDKSNEEILEIIKQQEKTDVYQRIRDYVAWKKERGIFDYVSVLRYFLTTTPVTLSLEKEGGEPRVMIMDESQDFSPLQWAVVRRLVSIGFLDYVIAAGDPNQSIYSFQGADSSEFGKFMASGTVVVLKRSHRLPKHVYNKAEMLTRWLGTHFEYEPREEQGKAITEYLKKSNLIRMDRTTGDKIVQVLEDIMDENKTVFVLTRTNKQARELEKYIIESGYRVSRIKNDDSLYDLLEEVIAFEERRSIGMRLFFAVTSLNEEGIRLRSLFKTPVEAIVKVEECFNIGKNLDDEDNRARDCSDTALSLTKFIEHHYLDVLDPEEKRVLAGLREKRNGKEVYVDTMHAAKGEEADIVIVIDFVNRKIEREIQRDRKALNGEVRVLYVAMTRAREKLYVLTSKSKRSILGYVRF
ncbi:ATP-dependent helicase [Thermococcus sp.]|uniref:UvrD-helicase domain-containing protein n=1 Tax=Thermococcus sp. TaxID=35749 RepID=UPI00260AC297|nr:ATP-dependent helicase [Thermococcus sp.]